MISITEKEDYTIISTEKEDMIVARGTARPEFTGGSFVLFDSELGSPTAKKPLFKISKINQLSSVVDKSGAALSLTDVEQLAKDAAKFFI